MSEHQERTRFRRSLEINGIDHLFPIFTENGVYDFEQLSHAVVESIVADPKDKAVIENMLDQLLQEENNTDASVHTISGNNFFRLSDITNFPSTSSFSERSSILSASGSRSLRNLEGILQRSLEGKVILSGAANEKINRRQLVKILIEEKLDENINRKISKEEFLEMRDEIVNTFPFEKREIYYIPSRTVNKKKMVARGILYDHYCNKRRKLIKLGLARKENEESEKKETRILSSTEEDDITWLKNSLDPWIMVIQKWNDTFQGRVMVTKDESIDGILNKFPAYRHNLGYTSIQYDFEKTYIDKSDNFFLNWPLKWGKLLKILMESTNKDIETFLEKSTPDQLDNSITALWLLPIYFPLKKIKKSSWRPSKLEAQEGFLLLVTSIADVQPNLVYKKNKYSQLKLTMQPLPILVGKSIFSIEKSFVSVNDILWEVESPLKAIDICFKCFHVLNAKYPSESEMVWTFIKCLQQELS